MRDSANTDIGNAAMNTAYRKTERFGRIATIIIFVTIFAPTFGSELILVFCTGMSVAAFLASWAFLSIADAIYAAQLTDNWTRRAPVSNSKHPASRPNDDGDVGGADSSE